MATPLDRVQVESGTGTGFTTVTTLVSAVANLPIRRVVFEVHNSGSNALTDLLLQVQAHPTADWQTLVSSTAWATTTKCVVAVVGTLQTLAGAAKGFAHVETGPVHAVRVRATAGTATTATVRMQLSN